MPSDGARDAGTGGRAPLFLALGAGALGALGLLPGARGACDPVGLVAWLSLIALPAGVLAGGAGARLWPVGLLAPALWSFLLLQVQLLVEPPLSPLATPSRALAVLTGLHFAGLALGRVAGARAPGLAGAALLALLALAAWPARGALGAGSSGAPGAPGTSGAPGPAARVAVDLSPLVLALECAGVDWTHAQPDMYAHSGVEWSPRLPHGGKLAGALALLVGWLLAVVSPRIVRRERTPRPLGEREEAHGTAQVLLHVPPAADQGTDHQPPAER